MINIISLPSFDVSTTGISRLTENFDVEHLETENLPGIRKAKAGLLGSGDDGNNLKILCKKMMRSYGLMNS